jgi:RNA polymerase sigma factor (sigma-70 family)
MATPQLRPVDSLHEEVFAHRYDSLLKWAGQLTGGDGALAEDLVHDAYVQFVLARPDLHKIQSIDRYLYGMLRNLHISYMRRATRTKTSSLLAVEYDSADLSLKHAGQQDQLRVLEQLWQACEYACARKETSRAGSVMILRFFHGYYPGEIAAIASSSKAALSESLRAAREEIIQYLRAPRSLSCIAGGRVSPLPRRCFRSDAEGSLVALMGTRPGYPTPRAMVADNDLALGRMVEAITRSRFWPQSAIFVLEGDAQDGPDHVDCQSLTLTGHVALHRPPERRASKIHNRFSAQDNRADPWFG